MRKIRVLHADDHAGFSGKLHEVLVPEFDWVGAVHEPDAVVPRVTELAPDVILLDVSMPRKSGFELAREILALVPVAKVIIVTVHGELAYVKEAFEAGASGYVLKTSVGSEIAAAVREVFAGGTFVSASLVSKYPRDFPP